MEVGKGTVVAIGVAGKEGAFIGKGAMLVLVVGRKPAGGWLGKVEAGAK